MENLGLSERKPSCSHWPGISLTNPRDSKGSLRVAFPNSSLRPHPCGLSSCWQAPTHTPGHARLSCTLLLQWGQRERRLEKPLHFGSRTGTPGCSLVFWGSVASLPVTEVCTKATLVPSRTLRGRGLRFALEAFKSPFPADSVMAEGASGLI